MPISPIYEWTEGETNVEVRVSIQGAARSKADIFATDSLLKINCPPYLLIIDLFGVVDDSKTVVTLSADGVTFRLVKVCRRNMQEQQSPECPLLLHAHPC